MTPIRCALICAIAALSLVAAVWLADVFLAPRLFSLMWQWPRSWVAPAAFALIVPILVGIPAGYSFGLLPWPRTLPPGLAVATIAPASEVIGLFAVSDLGDPRAWVYWLEAIALLLVFCFAAGSAA